MESMMTKRTTWILVAITIVVLVAAFVSTAGCVATGTVSSERMFINGTVEDVRYIPVGYNNFATYQIFFSDGRWTVVGSNGCGSVWGIDKTANSEAIENLKLRHQCSMLFEKTKDCWQLTAIEIN